jgi:60 kDa SS-A/Ro ribonucleoprotein
MNDGVIAGVPGLTPRIAAAALALVTAAVEPRHAFVAFSDRIVPVVVSPKERLDDVARALDAIPMGATDCSLPMLWALERGVQADSFEVYTDSETNTGRIHPAQALWKYRRETGIPAKLAVVAMTSGGFTIADPEDAGMLDVVGFDTATPEVLADFVRS